MRISNLIASFIMVGFAAQAAAEEAAPAKAAAKDPNAFATQPEGKTLPAGVMRARVVYGSTKGNGSYYDKDGNKKDSLISLSATGGALVFEYGLSDKLSLQIQQDFVGSFETTLKEDKLKASSNWAGYMTAAYSSTATAAKEIRDLEAGTKTTITSKETFATAYTIAVAGKLMATNPALCGNAASLTECVGKIQAGATAPTDIAPLGVKAGDKYSDIVAAKALTTDAALQAGVVSTVKAQAEKKGGKGMADTTVGVLYEAYKADNFAVAVAGGLRYPTGNRDRASNERPTGRGLSEFGARFNIDYTPIPTMALAWQNQSEVMAAAGKYNVAGESWTVSRKGVRNVGYVIVKPSLGGMSESLAFIAPKVGYAYDYDSQERIKKGSGTEAAVGDRANETKLLAGVAFNGFDFGLPLQLELEYKKSMSGKNVSAATDSMSGQLKAFYRF